MNIYESMRSTWETYCLMAGIAVIEEFSKPNLNVKEVFTKKGMKKYTYYSHIRLKMKDEKIVQWWLDTTRIWEKKLNESFINPKCIRPYKDGDQFTIFFNTNWAYQILRIIGETPSEATNKAYINKVGSWKGHKRGELRLDTHQIDSLRKFSLYPKLFEDKSLAAGAFIISFDLECKGVQVGRINLTMSEKFKDFLTFMLFVANKYQWATKETLTSVSVEYSINRGIKASPQFGFSLKSSKLKEIYDLAGPLLNDLKDRCIKLHANRSANYVNKGFLDQGKTKQRIYDTVYNLGETTTTEIQFFVNIGNDVINNHLNKLEMNGKLSKVRKGKGYIWSVKNAN